MKETKKKKRRKRRNNLRSKLSLVYVEYQQANECCECRARERSDVGWKWKGRKAEKNGKMMMD